MVNCNEHFLFKKSFCLLTIFTKRESHTKDENKFVKRNQSTTFCSTVCCMYCGLPQKSFVAFGILQKTYFLIFSGFAICNSARWRHPVTRHAAGENSNCNLARASTLKLMCLKIGSFLMQDSSNFMERRDKI